MCERKPEKKNRDFPNNWHLLAEPNCKTMHRILYTIFNVHDQMHHNVN